MSEKIKKVSPIWLNNGGRLWYFVFYLTKENYHIKYYKGGGK